jgi:hypothetical protein
MTRSFPGHLSRGERVKFLVDHRKKLGWSLDVALLDGAQYAGDLAHSVHDSRWADNWQTKDPRVVKTSAAWTGYRPPWTFPLGNLPVCKRETALAPTAAFPHPIAILNRLLSIAGVDAGN